jgi:hypothetical protein
VAIFGDALDAALELRARGELPTAAH